MDDRTRRRCSLSPLFPVSHYVLPIGREGRGEEEGKSTYEWFYQDEKKKGGLDWVRIKLRRKTEDGKRKNSRIQLFKVHTLEKTFESCRFRVRVNVKRFCFWFRLLGYMRICVRPKCETQARNLIPWWRESGYWR
ncbi:hypothetical protein PNOK_0945300 [Pyrrhoderma noxium]|uniref:Uncharacterized protein n=1 Tax=Pyrrhoderma noxium TaxID=2282107 RepID=A0A286U5R5_9AGAM|nr:hypothetical protein PNOK_0945300 [Pyrrhoderma noxium]